MPGHLAVPESRRTRDASRLRGGLDLGFALPLAHSSIWLRTAAGVANGDRNNTVANFYFGGFGNNDVDSGVVKRYREYWSLPGFGIDEIGGRRFAADGRMEPAALCLRIGRHAGPHLTWLRPAVFATGLWTDAGGSGGRRDVASVGGQVDFRFRSCTGTT